MRRAPVILLLCLLGYPASAGVPVVYDGGDANEIVDAVAQRTGLPTDELTAIPLTDLLQKEAATVGDAVMRRCTSEPATAADVRADLARAEAAWAKEDRVGAVDHLDLAAAHLGCLTELADPKVAARIFMLRGALEASTDLETAEGEMRTAMAFDEEITWDTSYPPEGEAVLSSQRTALATCVIESAPEATTTGPWLNGRPLTNAPLSRIVPDGLHLTQYRSPKGIQSAWLLVGGDATVVVPTGFKRPVLERTVDNSGREALEALLAVTIDDFEVGYVTWGGGLWLVTSDEDERSTTEIAPALPPEAEEPTKGKKKKKKKK